MKYIFTVLFFALFVNVQAQIVKPAKFVFTASKSKPKVGEIIELIFTAEIDKEWKLYATDNTLNPGPIPAEVSFTKNDTYELVGEMHSVKPHTKQDSFWKGKVSYFTSKATFIQKVKVLKPKAIIEGKLKYQTCTLKDGSCVIGKDKISYTF